MSRSPTSPESARAASVAGSSNRAFGLVFAGFFTVVGLLPLRHGAGGRGCAFVVAGIFLLLALAWPAALAWPNRLWTKFGELLHRVTSPVAITGIYLVGVVPAGVVMRLLGKDPLRLKRDPAAASYWIPRVPPVKAGPGMKHQF
ncbi:MAG: hypothetical protein RLZZ15_8 [Verrucomicrobiota bacterium]|jgi:hypothetical protein